jgi:hypothetical protein
MYDCVPMSTVLLKVTRGGRAGGRGERETEGEKTNLCAVAGMQKQQVTGRQVSMLPREW